MPLHGWLPDAHSQANTAGSVLLAGLLIKVGAYGMLRFLIPLFPHASFDIRYVAMGLGVAGILYGAVMAFAQTDLKRMVAYTSVSHMGFVLLGVFAWNELALQGVVLQIVCHAFSTGGLFILAGVLEERLGTRDLGGMGGLWARLSTLGRVRDGPRHGGAGPARLGQLRGRVPHPAGDVPGEPARGHRRVAGAGRRDGLRAVAGAAGVPRPRRGGRGANAAGHGAPRPCRLGRSSCSRSRSSCFCGWASTRRPSSGP